MHGQLCKAFAVKDRDRVWLGGKVPVIAFSRGEYFAAFEEEFFKSRVDPCTRRAWPIKSPPARSSSVATRATIPTTSPPCWSTKRPTASSTATSRRSIIPNWLNEGMAEWVAMNVVLKDQGVKRKMKGAMLAMRQTGTLGGDFFTAEHIAAGQYGMATAMVDYLLRTNPKGFRAMFDNIKLGESWQNALRSPTA